jgi:hypothetical protein
MQSYQRVGRRTRRFWVTQEDARASLSILSLSRSFPFPLLSNLEQPRQNSNGGQQWYSLLLVSSDAALPRTRRFPRRRRRSMAGAVAPRPGARRWRGTTVRRIRAHRDVSLTRTSRSVDEIGSECETLPITRDIPRSRKAAERRRLGLCASSQYPCPRPHRHLRP